MEASQNTVNDSNISRKISRGAAWMALTSLSLRSMNILSNIVLARILAPKDLGLIAIAMAIIYFSQGLTQFGMQSALIQKQKDIDKFLNIAWTFDLVRCFGLFLCVFIGAGWLSEFFHEEKARAIIQVLATTYLLQGLRNIGLVYFRKELNFHKQFLFQTCPMLINLVTVTTLAFVLRSVWALVIAQLVFELVTLIMSYILHPYRPRLEWNKEKFYELMSFGKWIFGSSILYMVSDQGSDMFIEKMFGIASLGIYNRSVVFSTKLFFQIIDLIWSVGYPTYALFASDREKLAKAFQQTMIVGSFFGCLLAVGLYALREPFVYVVLSAKWRETIPVIAVLAAQGLLVLLTAPSAVVFQATGNTYFGVKSSFMSLLLAVASLYFFTKGFGLIGVPMAHCFGMLVTLPYTLGKVKNLTGVSMTPIAVALGAWFIAAGLTTALVAYLSPLLFSTHTWASFITMGSILTASYILISLAYDHILNIGLWRAVMVRIRAFKS